MWGAVKGSMGWCFCQARLRTGEKEMKTQSQHPGEVAVNLGAAEVGSRACLGFSSFMAELC